MLLVLILNYNVVFYNWNCSIQILEIYIYNNSNLRGKLPSLSCHCELPMQGGSIFQENQSEKSSSNGSFVL